MTSLPNLSRYTVNTQPFRRKVTEKQSRQGDGIIGTSKTLSDPVCERCKPTYNHIRNKANHNIKWNIASSKSKRDNIQLRTGTQCEQKLGNTKRIRRKNDGRFRVKESSTRHRKGKLSKGASHYASRPESAAESVLVRKTDGFAYRVDEHTFPRGRGVEPDRNHAPLTTDRRYIKDRRDRVHLLGNGVVPQIPYLIALQIHKYLLAFYGYEESA